MHSILLFCTGHLIKNTKAYIKEQNVTEPGRIPTSFKTLTHSDPGPANWAVSLGSVLRSGVGALVIPVQRVIIHPAFNGTNMDFDIALLELAVPAPISYTIQSVCLPSPVHHFLKNAQCYITGWGSMREGGERTTH